MIRRLFTAFGLVALFVPRRLVEFWEGVAFENPADADRRTWTIPMARLEGLCFLALVARDEDASALSTVLALAGIPIVFAPQTYLRTGLGLAYENPDDIRVKRWVVPLARVLGLVYLVAGLRRLGKNGRDGESS